MPVSVSDAVRAPRRRGARPLAAALLLGAVLGTLLVPVARAQPALTPIPAIQGPGARSPLEGQTVRTRGVVTRLNTNGFFLQDPQGDGDPRTSDAVFVFTGGAPTVAVGQQLELGGTVVEFAATPADADGRTTTQLVNPTQVTVLADGQTVAPVVLTLPVARVADLERLEGMLVTIPGPLTVTQNFFQARFGQLTLAAGGRLEAPTNRHRPGPQAAALADANQRRTIVLDDGSPQRYPNPVPWLAAAPRAGDTVDGLTGVLDDGQTGNAPAATRPWRLHPVAEPVFRATHPRTPAPAPVGGNLKIASFNLQNHFSAFTDGGGTADGCALGGVVARQHCRGADNAAEFARQQAKLVAALAAIDADVVGVMEVQNNGNVALQSLVDALNARLGAGTYAAGALPPDAGTDAIRVGLLYKPARLQPVGAALSDADPVHHRPPLAQAFRRTGAAADAPTLTLVVNHFKSKGSCPAPGTPEAATDADRGDGQACWNATRVRQAQRLAAFVAAQQAAGAVGPDVLLIGDFNAYAQEDPIDTLRQAGFDDLVARLEPEGGHSFVFDGLAGRLDHALASPALAPRVRGVTHWHINADEPAVRDYNLEFKAPAAGCGPAGCPRDPYAPDPYRASDHDPLVIGVQF